MTTIEAFTYANGSAPVGYHCERCDRTGVKLWRQYNTFIIHLTLLCGSCALADQNKPGPIAEDGRRESDGIRTDQVGWLIPAVPTEDGETFWGYSSVPMAGVDWWRRLPT